jgi:YidC/Oxa1 family membrane protein insertase
LNPTLTKNGEDQFYYAFKSGANEYLEYNKCFEGRWLYVRLDIQSQGLNKVLNTSKPLNLEWDLKTILMKKVLVMKTVIQSCITSTRRKE